MYEDKLKAMELIVQLAGYGARAFRDKPKESDEFQGHVAAFQVVTAVLASWMGVSQETGIYMVDSITDMMERIHDAEPTS